MTSRVELRAELSSRLVPALISRGFGGPRLIAGNALLHEFFRSGPFGTQHVTIQLEKYGKPRFLLLFNIEPIEGFAALTARGGAVVQGRLQLRRGVTSRSWFRADGSLWQRLFGRVPGASEAVGACLALLPELDVWWQTQGESKHIQNLTVQFPGEAAIEKSRSSP